MLGRTDNVRYYLNVEGKEPILIPEPINYDDGNGNIYEYDDKSNSYIVEKKSELEYPGAGYETLVGEFAVSGIINDVRETKQQKNPNRLDERWEFYGGDTYIDTSQLEKDDVRRTVTAKSVQGGLRREIDDFWSEEYDLTLETSEDEIDIGKPETITANIDSREIFLRSRLEVDDSIEIAAAVSGGDNLNARAINFLEDYNSDEQNVRGVYGSNLNAGGGNYARIEDEKRSNTFYYEAEKDTTIELTGNIKVTQTGTPHSGTFFLDLTRFNGDNYDFVEVVTIEGVLQRVSGNPALTGSSVELVFNKSKVDIKKGDSLAISTLSNTSDGIKFRAEGELIIEEDSIEPPSTSRAFLPFKLFERIIANATGKQMRFKSNLFSTGKWKHLAVAPVYWIRQFPDIVNEGTDEERRIQAKTSLSDAYTSYSAIEPLAWWIERVNDVEVMRIELLSYTQQNFASIHYGTTADSLVTYLEVSDLKSKTLPNNFFKTLKLGAEKGGGEYEEVNGLQSVGGMATFKTINKKGTGEYEKLSKYATASEYIEIPRRKPYSKFPDTDTRYDSDWVFLDLKYENGIYTMRKWQDDYDSAPKNVYRPNSLTNIRLNPAQLLLNHYFIIKAGLYHNK